MKGSLARPLAIFALLLLSACHSTRNAPVVPQAPPGQAQVVFFRPTKTLQEVSVYLLDADQGGGQFLGRVHPQTKVAAAVPPGDHLFMVVGDQTAEFMQARLSAGNTYYVLLRGHFDGGTDWHFFMLPMHRESGDSHNLQSRDFRKWEHACVLVEKSPEDEQWYAENRSSVNYLRAFYLKGWNQRSDEERAKLTLNAEDGVVALEPEVRRGRSAPASAMQQQSGTDGR